MIGIYIIVAVVVILLIFFVVTYNRLVRMHNGMANTWAQLDVQLKRRYGLIPNLVETVKAYTRHERRTLEEVIKARKSAQSLSAGPAGRAQAEAALDGALDRLLAVVENYPDLRASRSYLFLQRELASTEDGIGTARQIYNDMVLMCNNLYHIFPSNVVARLFGYRTEEYFEAESAIENEVPAVSL